MKTPENENLLIGHLTGPYLQFFKLQTLALAVRIALFQNPNPLGYRRARQPDKFAICRWFRGVRRDGRTMLSPFGIQFFSAASTSSRCSLSLSVLSRACITRLSQNARWARVIATVQVFPTDFSNSWLFNRATNVRIRFVEVRFSWIKDRSIGMWESPVAIRVERRSGSSAHGSILFALRKALKSSANTA